MICFYGKELLAPRPNPKLKNHSLLAVYNCLLNIFAATLHTESHLSICKQRTCHTMVTGILESRIICYIAIFISLLFILRLFLSLFLFVWVHGTTPRFWYVSWCIRLGRDFCLFLWITLCFLLVLGVLFLLCYSALTTQNPTTTKRKLYLLL
jgi:hypothetical protein